MVSSLDDSVGRVVASLGARGLLKDSLILFMTDNGAASVGKFRNFGSNWPLRGVSNNNNESLSPKRLLPFFFLLFCFYSFLNLIP